MYPAITLFIIYATIHILIYKIFQIYKIYIFILNRNLFKIYVSRNYTIHYICYYSYLNL